MTMHGSFIWRQAWSCCITHLSGLVILLSISGCASTKQCIHAGADFAPDEEEAVLAAVDEVLLAMAAGDKTAYARALTPEGMTYSQRWADGKWLLRRRSNQEDIDMLDDETEAVAEVYWDPTVFIRGPIAVVWTPYEFRRGGAVSHCGVDVFEMLKIDGRWIMGNAMWTVEPGACQELKPTSGSRIRPQELAKQ